MLTRTLIVINVLAFLWEISVVGPGIVSGAISSQPTRLDDFVLIPFAVLQQHQYYRIVTGAFLHWSILHIGMNMLSLYWLGRFMEVVLRPMKMAIVYFVSLVVSGLSVVFFAEPMSATLGASGAIFGLFGALFAIGLKLGERGRDLVRGNIGILFINLAFTFSVHGISWQAHVGGLISGFIVTYLIFSPPKPVYAQVYDSQSGAAYESHLEMPDDQRH